MRQAARADGREPTPDEVVDRGPARIPMTSDAARIRALPGLTAVLLDGAGLYAGDPGAPAGARLEVIDRRTGSRVLRVKPGDDSSSAAAAIG